MEDGAEWEDDDGGGGGGVDAESSQGDELSVEGRGRVTAADVAAAAALLAALLAAVEVGGLAVADEDVKVEADDRSFSRAAAAAGVP